jgi:iron complex outermembrane receptor protein
MNFIQHYFSASLLFCHARKLGMMILIFVPGFIHAQALSTDTLKKMSLEELMNLEVVSVSKRSEKLIRAASAIQVITQEDIRHSGATNVPEALRLASNLQVAQVNSSQWAISARGFNNVLANKLLVLIDGRVVYTPMYAGVFWDVQNLLLEDIERIEVISGPGGTLWGANAVNGVINIITKSTRDTKGFFAEAATGTTLHGLGSLRYGGKLNDNISYRIYGTAFKRGNVIYEDSSEVNDNWKMAQTGLRVDWDASEKDDIMFQMNLYDGRPDPDGNNPIIASGNNLLARWNRTFSERSGLQLQAYYDKTWRDFRNDFTEALRTYDLEAQHRFTLGKRHELIYGFGFRYMDHEVENLELFAFRPGRKSLYLYNVFLQDEITVVHDKLRLILGLKLEHNSYTGYQHQPNARVNWTPTETQTVWAAASRAVRNPARIDREFYLSLAPGVDFIEGSNTRSEEVLAYELGWRFQPVNSLSLSLATFYNIYDHIRSVEPGPPPFGIPLTFGNGVKGETYGIEFSATHQLTSALRLRAGYTFLKKELRVKPDSEDMNEASAESNDPSHQLMLQSIVNLPHGIEFGTVLRHVSKLSDPYVSDYTGLDIRLAWRIIDAIELNIVGQNLLQKSHTEFIPDSPYPKSIERSIYIKLVGRL